MNNKKQDILFISLILTILSILSIYIIIKPVNEKSDEENRYLVSFRNINGSSFLDGSLQDVIEDSYADQFPKRNLIVKFKNILDETTKSILTPTMSELTLNQIPNETIMRLGNTSYMINMIIENNEENMNRFIQRAVEINELANRHKDVEVFVYEPTQAHEISLFDEDTGIIAGAPKLWKAFEETIEVPFKKFNLDSLDLYKEVYYKSDHHPTHIGADIFYNEIMELINPEEKTLKPTKTDCHVGDTFYGTFASRTGFIFEPDTFCVYQYDVAPYNVYVKNELVINYTNRKDFENFDPSTVEEQHPYYYNYAYKVYDNSSKEIYDSTMLYDTNRDDLKNILVIGDSYSNSVIDLIASHYNKTYRVLPYNEVIFNGKMFDYDKFIIENDIDVILFMYTVENYYYVDEWGDRYMQTQILENGGVE